MFACGSGLFPRIPQRFFAEGMVAGRSGRHHSVVHDALSDDFKMDRSEYRVEKFSRRLDRFVYGQRAADPARVGGILYFKSGHLSGFGDRGRHYHADREIPFEKTDHFESFRDHRQDSGRGIFGRGHDAVFPLK